MLGPYRAEKSRFNDSWNIERQFPCINGLSAWFQIAVVHEADEAEIGYTDGAFGSGEERANQIVAALNIASQQPVGWAYELANAIWPNGDYDNWTAHVSADKPNVPPGSIRNLRPLYAGAVESPTCS